MYVFTSILFYSILFYSILLLKWAIGAYSHGSTIGKDGPSFSISGRQNEKSSNDSPGPGNKQPTTNYLDRIYNIFPSLLYIIYSYFLILSIESFGINFLFSSFSSFFLLPSSSIHSLHLWKSFPHQGLIKEEVL